MNRYLSNLIGRTQQMLPVLRPRPVSMFESPRAADSGLAASMAASAPPAFSPPNDVPAPKNNPVPQNAPPVEDIDTGNHGMPLPTIAPKNAQTKPTPPPLEFEQTEELSLPATRRGKAVDQRLPSLPSQPEKPAAAFSQQPRPSASPPRRADSLPPQRAPLPAVPSVNATPDTAVSPRMELPGPLPSLQTAPNMVPPQGPKAASALLSREIPPLVTPVAVKNRQDFNEATDYPTPTIVSPKERPLPGERQANGRSLRAASRPPTIPVREAAVGNPQRPGPPTAPSHQEADPTPTIQVKIGRVEVRAQAAADRPKSTKKERQNKVLSLNDYLNRRQGGNP